MVILYRTPLDHTETRDIYLMVWDRFNALQYGHLLG